MPQSSLSTSSTSMFHPYESTFVFLEKLTCLCIEDEEGHLEHFITDQCKKTAFIVHHCPCHGWPVYLSRYHWWRGLHILEFWSHMLQSMWRLFPSGPSFFQQNNADLSALLIASYSQSGNCWLKLQASQENTNNFKKVTEMTSHVTKWQTSLSANFLCECVAGTKFNWYNCFSKYNEISSQGLFTFPCLC